MENFIYCTVFQTISENCNTINLAIASFLIMLQTGVLQFYLQKHPSIVVFCEFCKIFKSTYFEKHLQTTGFETKCFKDLYAIITKARKSGCLIKNRVLVIKKHSSR